MSQSKPTPIRTRSSGETRLRSRTVAEKKKAVLQKGRRRREVRLRKVEDRLLAVEAKLKVMDKHYAELLAPIIGVQALLKAHAEREAARDRKIDLLYRGVDSLLKSFNPAGGGMAGVEAEG